MSEHIKVVHEDGILRLRFDRPDKKNALTHAMYRVLADALEGAEDDQSVRVIVFEGSGDSFTAGNDLRDFLNAPPLDDSAPVIRFLFALARSTVPMVAAVHGAAIGVGTTMLLHCDCVIATPEARLQMPFVALGLVPEAGSSYLLPRLVGPARAAELLLTCAAIDGAQAHSLGLVTRLCGGEQLAEMATEVARAIAAQPPEAARAAKSLLKSDRDTVVEQIRREAALFAERLRSPECAQALTAFVEKRDALA